MGNAIQFDREAGQWTVKVQSVAAQRVLTAEFESG